MKTKRRIVYALALVALAALVTLGTFGGTERARAQDQLPPPVPDRISFGMVGITQGQTVRLSVVNTIPPPQPDRAAEPTHVVLTFLDSEGRRFRNRDGSFVRRAAQLQPGQATFLDLSFDQIPPPVGDRLQFRAVVTVEPPPVGDNNETPPPVGDRTGATVEVINNANGRTAFAISAPPAIQKQPPAHRRVAGRRPPKTAKYQDSIGDDLRSSSS